MTESPAVDCPRCPPKEEPDSGRVEAPDGTEYNVMFLRRTWRRDGSDAPFDPRKDNALMAARHAVHRLREAGWCT